MASLDLSKYKKSTIQSDTSSKPQTSAASSSNGGKKTMASTLSDKRSGSEKKSTSASKKSTTSTEKKGSGSNVHFDTSGLKRSDTSVSSFRLGKNIYKKNYDGSYSKAKAFETQSDKDKASVAKTGHETVLTDLGQAIEGGAKSWLSSQMSTGATLGLAYNALKNKDNYYQPQVGSTLWKLTNASHANTEEANELIQNSTEGRGFVGKTAMTVASQAVMNGIDIAISSLPGGQVLGKISFASRAFGGTAQEQRDEGKSVGTQVLSGSISAAIELATESMSMKGGVKDYLGGDTAGWLDNVYTGLESVLTKKGGTFSVVLGKMAVTMGSEAVEEIAADILHPLVSGMVSKATEGSSWFGDYEAEEWQSIGDIAYDGLIGSLSAIGGGLVESAGAVNTYNNVAHGDNTLYSTILRQEYESNKAMSREARMVRTQSIFDAVNTLFNNKTGETLSERASKAAGKYVSNKNVGKVLAQRDQDFMSVVNEVADKFSNQSFANEVVDKSVLRQAVVNFFVTGDFSEDLNSISGAKAQLESFANEVMKAKTEQRLEQARTMKDKTREAYYSSMLSNLVNGAFAEQQTTGINADEVTTYKSYGYTAEELAEDQAKRAATAEAETAEAETAEAAETATEAATEEETTPTVKLKKTDTDRIDRIFGDYTKKVLLGDTARDQAISDAIYARAEAEGKQVVADVVHTKKGDKVVLRIANKVDTTETAETTATVEATAEPAVDTATVAEEVAETESENEAETAVDEETLWTAPKDNSGWKEKYNGDNPMYDALKIADPKLAEAMDAEWVEGNTNTPIVNAYVSAYNDVRQGTISPMAAVTLLSNAYSKGGISALNSLWNHGTGNLYQAALDVAKQIDATHASQQTETTVAAEAETATAEETTAAEEATPTVEVTEEATAEEAPATEEAEATAETESAEATEEATEETAEETAEAETEEEAKTEEKAEETSEEAKAETEEETAEEAEAEAEEETEEAEAETEEAEGEETAGEEETAEEEKKEAEQPKAKRKKSAAEAHEVAEKTFGKEGLVKATKVVEAFDKLKLPFKKGKSGNYTAKAQQVATQMEKMSDLLKDVNDGYGTVKAVYFKYKAWRDNKTMSSYYDSEVSYRLSTLINEAKAKNWEFTEQEQAEFAQAYEEACNAMIAKINNVNNDTSTYYKLRGEALANKLNVKNDGLVSKAIQKWFRMQATMDTAMKFFGGFKGSGQFYSLSQQIKDSVSKRMVTYVNAYSYFDSLKEMKGFKEFSENKKTFKLDIDSEKISESPFSEHEFTIQQVVAMRRLLKTLDATVFKDSDLTAEDRVKGFTIKDAKGNSYSIDMSEFAGEDTSGSINAVIDACDKILNQDTDIAKCAKAYNEACDKMFKSLGKEVSAVKKAITGNGLVLLENDYTPLLWENENGEVEFNFNKSDRVRAPAFTRERTESEGYLVVQDISFIVDKYIMQAADYVGTAQMKNTLASLNDGISLVNDGKGLNSVLAENFGKEAGSWFNEYVKDVTQYSENDSIWAELRKRMQQGALIGSPSVMMKQTSSYWSAMGILSPQAMIAAYRWKVGVKAEDSSEYNKLLKYRKTTENIDPTLTEIIKSTEKYGKASNSRVFQLFTNGISAQDFKTVDNLYTATRLDTYLKNQNKGTEYFSSGEFQNDVDTKFAEVMMRSQPMFDTELRAEYARTDKELIKMTSMFRTQQTQNLNLIITAIGEYNAARGTEAQGEKAKVLRQTVTGQVSAALSLSLLTVAADFMLHGLKKYRGDGDDDDDEPGDGKIELIRILSRIGLNTVESSAGIAWGGDYIAKWLIDRMSGGETSEFYGVNFGPLTTLQNIFENLENVTKSPTPANIKNVATNISQLMGIPLNNAYRIVNSACMYVADATGQNDSNYDDVLRMWKNDVTVAEKNDAGKNLLIEYGMTKKEATAFIKEIDEDDNGLNKEELKEYYLEHPEDAEKVSLLWDSMGWKTPFEKAKQSMDKQIVYNSNPLYAEIDADESGSITKTELTNYALEHADQSDELEQIYEEQGFKGKFSSALQDAESAKLRETAETAFDTGNYNVLFETVTQMKNGKSWLTSMIKEETGNEYATTTNMLLYYITSSDVSAKTMDSTVESLGSDKLVSQYKVLRKSGLSPKAAARKLDVFDSNDNGSVTQAELAEYYKSHKDEEDLIKEFWDACGWKKTWKQYKKTKKIA